MVSIVFVGAVQLSAEALDELIKQGIKPQLICTLYPHLAHRHSDFMDLRPVAETNDVPVLHVDSINAPDVIKEIRKLQPDYIFVIGWSQILKPELLNLARKSTVGFHFAYLPKNRGRAAIPWTIINKDTEAGVSLMHLDDGVDTGDLITQYSYAVDPEETSETLYKKVCVGLRKMMADVSRILLRDEDLPANPQNHSEATYLAKRTVDDGWIDWEKDSEDIDRLIRASGYPYPGAFTVYNGQKLIIWKARLRRTCNQIGTIGQILTLNEDKSATIQCGRGWVDLLEVQGEHTNSLPAASFFKRSHERLGINIYQLWKAQQELVQKVESLDRENKP